MPVNAFVVRHPEGICLFDAGQCAAAAEPGYFPAWHPFFRPSRFELRSEDETAAQLRRVGIAPQQVRWVVLSHMHTDHVGGVRAFTDAEVLVSDVEWGRAQGLGGRLRGYLPQYWPDGLHPRLVRFDDAPVGPFASSFDLCGDGRLVLVPTPGHTSGHIAMLVTLGRGRWLLCGDLVHTRSELVGIAPQIDRFCREHQIVVLATHDADADTLLAADAGPSRSGEIVGLSPVAP